MHKGRELPRQVLDDIAAEDGRDDDVPVRDRRAWESWLELIEEQRAKRGSGHRVTRGSQPTPLEPYRAATVSGLIPCGLDWAA